MNNPNPFQPTPYPRRAPPQIVHPYDVLREAGLVGTGTLCPGLIFGSVYGTLKTQTPVLWTLFTGAQWFAIGSTFWTYRSLIIQQDGVKNWWYRTRGLPIVPRTDTNPSPSDRVRASTIAGTLTGATVAMVFRGPQNVIPGMIMFTLFGWGGQRGYNYLDERNTQQLRMEHESLENGIRPEKPTFMQRMLASKWSPMSVLSDEEYLQIMTEKLKDVTTELVSLDQKLAKLQQEQAAEKAQQEKTIVQEEKKDGIEKK